MGSQRPICHLYEPERQVARVEGDVWDTTHEAIVSTDSSRVDMAQWQQRFLMPDSSSLTRPLRSGGKWKTLPGSVNCDSRTPTAHGD